MNREEWKIQEAEARRAGKPWPPPTGPIAELAFRILKIFWSLFLAMALVAVLRHFYLNAASNWTQVAETLRTPTGAFKTAVVVVCIACVFFILRQRTPLFYGFTELVAAAITAYDTCNQIVMKSLDPPHWLLLLLSSLYIAVRGFDNINRALNVIPDITKSKMTGNA